MKEEALFNQAKICLDQGDYEQAIALLELCIEDNAEEIEFYWYLGLAYLLKGNEEAGQDIWMSVFLQGTEEDISVWTAQLTKILESYYLSYLSRKNLKLVKLILNTLYTLDEAYDNSTLSLEIDRCLKNTSQTALVLAQAGEYAEAEIKFKQILEIAENDEQTWYNLGVLYYQSQQITLALNAVQVAIAIKPDKANFFYLLGRIWEYSDNLESLEKAISAYQKTINLENNYIDAYNNLGNCYKKLMDYESAEKAYRQAMMIDASHCGSYINLGKILLLQKRHQESINIYKQAEQNTLTRVELYDNWVETLNQIGKTQEAIQIGETAIKQFPDDLFLRRKVKLLLPILYNSVSEIESYRQRFTRGLSELLVEVHSDYVQTRGQEIKDYIWKSGTSETNFYLTYQGKNDVTIQQQYGEFVETIIHNSYPQWLIPLPFSQRKHPRIRIGYLSARMHTLLGKLTSGWLKYHNPEKFEIYSYNLGTLEKSINHQDFKDYSDFYYDLPSDIETICQQIRENDLNILVFIDIGMDAIMTVLASMRLAPIQCTTWSHPITSGLSTIDYFLSSDLMEPENSASHYSEKLVLLPNLGVAFPQPIIPPSTLSRADFGLDNTSILYLSSQSQFKYLPQYDFIYPQIARQVPNAKFLFIESPISKESNTCFQKRLNQVFADYGLNEEEFVIILPRLGHDRFLAINQLANIFLDTFAWSGGITTFHALACDLPVVTCPGEFMRGRHSYGILKMMNLTETIADSPEKYLEIAIRLALDTDWYAEIKEKIIQNKHLIYEDQVCVKALEEFYLSTVNTPE